MLLALLTVVLAQSPKLPPLKCDKGQRLVTRQADGHRVEECVRNQWSVRGRAVDERGRVRSEWGPDDAGVKHRDELLETGQRVARWRSDFVSTLEAAWWPAGCQRVATVGGDRLHLPRCPARCEGDDGGARVLVLPSRFARELDLAAPAHEGLPFEVTRRDGGALVCAAGRCEVLSGVSAMVTPDGAGLLAFFERPDGGFLGRLDVRDGGLQPLIALESPNTWAGATSFLVGEPQRLVDGLSGKTLLARTPCGGPAWVLDDGSLLCTDRDGAWTRTWPGRSVRCDGAKTRELWALELGPRVLRLDAPRAGPCDEVFHGLVDCAPGLE